MNREWTVDRGPRALRRALGRRRLPWRLSRAASPPPAQEPSDAESAGSEFNFVEFSTEALQHRTQLGEIPALLWRAVALTYRAGRTQLILVVALSIFGALLTATQILFAKQALDAVIQVGTAGRAASSALTPFVVMGVIAAVAGVSAILAEQLQRLVGERAHRATLRNVIDVCTRVDLEAFESPAFFNRLQRVVVNAPGRPATVTNGVIGLTRGAVGVIGLSAVLLTLAPLLVPILLLVAVPLTLTSRRGSRLELQFAADQASGMRKRYYLEEILHNRPAAKEVRAFGLGPELISRWDARWDEYLLALRGQVGRRARLAIIGRVGASALAIAAVALLLYLLQRHAVSLASAGAAGMSLLLLAGRVEGMSHSGNGLYESALFLKDLERFLSLRDLPLRGSRGGEPASPFHELRAEGLSFTYPTSNEPSLDGVDITIRAGEVVALVGENGSGKTTLAKLLADLYRPSGGAILWNGREMEELEATSVRDQVAVIFQDFVTYALSAAENIGVGRPGSMHDIEGIKDAARQSGAHSFLSTLPEGYDNYLLSLFEGGRDLSLGQWQRVALARAFFRDAPFVILDEPSSALDARAEHDLFVRMRSMLQGRTALMISHRFSSVRSADRIYVMKEGRIVEHGTHESLMDEGGLYSELFTIQADAYLAKETA